MTDSLSLLRLYVEWGADEALDSHPHDWMAQAATIHNRAPVPQSPPIQSDRGNGHRNCLLYTSDAADDTPCVDLGGRRIIKKTVAQGSSCALDAEVHESKTEG